MPSVPATFNLADIWESTAERVPERIAVVCDGVRRTYGELDDRATRLAHWMLDQGVRARPARRSLPHQRARVLRGDARVLQGARRPDQRELPLRRRRAAAPLCRRRPRGGPGAARVPGTPGRDRRRPARPRGGASSSASPTRRRWRLRRRLTTSVPVAATTTTSSTPAARPVCRRASCGPTRTPSTPASAAATRVARAVASPSRPSWSTASWTRRSCSCPSRR